MAVTDAMEPSAGLDLGPSEEDTQQPAAAPAPALQAFQDIFTDPLARDWAGQVVTQLNDFTTKRDLADRNAAAGENFVADLGQFRSGMLSFVQNDPHALSTALDIIPLTIGSMLSSIPGLDDAEGRGSAITGELQQQAAATAVTFMAQRDEGQARDMLSAHSDLLGDQAGPLGDYITLMAHARSVDERARARQEARGAEISAERATISHLATLYNPMTDSAQITPGWMATLMSDRALKPADQLALGKVYNRLEAGEDVAASDPYLLTQLASRSALGSNPTTKATSASAPTVSELVSQIGSGLKLGDAMAMIGGTGTPDVQRKAEYANLSAALLLGQRELAAPENGFAGKVAFQRFVDEYVMPTFRAQGAAALVLTNPDGTLTPAGAAMQVQLQKFAPSAALPPLLPFVTPTAEQAVALGGKSPPTFGQVQSSTQDRKSLNEIFSLSGHPELEMASPKAEEAIKPIRDIQSGYRLSDTGGIEPIPRGASTSTRTAGGTTVIRGPTHPPPGTPPERPELTPEQQQLILEGRGREAGIEPERRVPRALPAQQPAPETTRVSGRTTPPRRRR